MTVVCQVYLHKVHIRAHLMFSSARSRVSQKNMSLLIGELLEMFLFFQYCIMFKCLRVFSITLDRSRYIFILVEIIANVNPSKPRYYTLRCSNILTSDMSINML